MDLLAKSHNHIERIAELCQSLCDLLVHGERSAPNCFHEEKFLRPNEDFFHIKMLILIMIKIKIKIKIVSHQDVDSDHDKKIDKDKHCFISRC